MANTLEIYLEAGHGGSVTVTEPVGPLAVTFQIPAVLAPGTALATGLATALNASALVGTYTVALGADYRLTIARTDGGLTFALVLSGAAQALLGYTSGTYAAATSRTSEGVVAYKVPCLAIELAEPTPAQLHELEVRRHGRFESSTWGPGRKWQVYAAIASTAVPVGYQWLTAGRVRVTPLGDSAALTTANLDGAVTGAVLAAEWSTESVGLVQLTMTILEV